eukprot:jgi/Botrbrau1/7879/Bobra.9_2s0053.2
MGLFTKRPKMPKKKVQLWTRDDVMKWLTFLNMGKYAEHLGDDIDGPGLLRLTSIDIYTMTSSRQDGDAIIQSLSALRNSGDMAQGQASPFNDDPSSSQQPDEQESPQIEDRHNQQLSSLVGGKDVITQLFQYLEQIGIRGHGLIDATNHSSIVGLLISALWELHDVAESAKSNKLNCKELVRFSQDILRIMDAQGKALSAHSTHLTMMLRTLEDAINLVDRCCKDGWMKSMLLDERAVEDFQSIHNMLLDILRASRLDTLPNGRQLTHGDYRDASRPLKRIIKQLGNGSWQEGLRVVATNDDAAAEVMQLIGVPLEDVKLDATRCVQSETASHAEIPGRGLQGQLTEKECFPIFQKYAGPSNLLDTVGWGTFLFDIGMLEDVKPAEMDAFLLQEFRAADTNGDGFIDLGEFMSFYSGLSIPKPLRHLREAIGTAHESALRKIFKSFASFGVRQQQHEMDGVRFSKLARDCKLIGAHLTQTDIDIIFATVKTKGSRRISFDQFVGALILMAEKKGQPLAETVVCVLNTPCPAVSATVPEYVRLNDDKSTYTGVYARGGPTNVEPSKDLSAILDRSPADMRGVKKLSHDLSALRVSLPHSLHHTPVSTPTSGGPAGRSPKIGAWISPSIMSENRSPALSSPKEMLQPVKEGDLQAVFDAFASFGLGTINRPEKLDMDGAKFAKLCRESGLICSRFGTTSVDLIFSKVKAKGARKIHYIQFKHALRLIADEKKVPLEHVEALLVKAGGPRRNATSADFVRLHDDKSTFTGAHPASLWHSV